jgi:hypothetical protein
MRAVLQRFPGTPPRTNRIGALLACFSAAALAVLFSADAQAQAPPATPRQYIQVHGEGDQTVYVVDHGDTWSMHAENVLADNVFSAWAASGGPRSSSKTPLDHPFTLSVHRLAPERIVERLLDGYGYTLHYDAEGRLATVRVYSAEPTRMYKTPRLTQTRARWSQTETALLEEAVAAGAREDGTEFPQDDDEGPDVQGSR